MQTRNPDYSKKTKFIHRPRARRTDAEPIIHKVSLLVIIGSFFILIYNENLPRPTGKEKNRGWAGGFCALTLHTLAAVLRNQSRRFFLL